MEFWARPFLLAPQAAKKAKAKPAAKPAAAPAKAEPEAAPADAVRAESTGSHAGPPTRPVLPSDDFVGDAAPIITKIVEWTKPQLQKLAADNGWLKPSETLEGLGPLPFAPSGADRSTYKESFHINLCGPSGSTKLAARSIGCICFPIAAMCRCGGPRSWLLRTFCALSLSRAQGGDAECCGP